MMRSSGVVIFRDWLAPADGMHRHAEKLHQHGVVGDRGGLALIEARGRLVCAPQHGELEALRGLDCPQLLAVGRFR